MFSIEVRPALKPSPKLGTSLLPLLPWFRVSGSESFQLGFWPHYLPALWIQKSSPRIAWALSLITPGSDGIFCLLELLLLFYLSFCWDSSDCLVCLNLELLPCPPSLVRPVPTAPLAPESWVRFPHLDFTLLISYPNTNGPHLSPFPPPVPVVGPGFPWPGLSCCWSYVNWDPTVLTVKVKNSVRYPLWLSYTWKRILWPRVFVDGRNKEVRQLSRGGLPLSSVEGSSYHPAKHWKPFKEDWKQTSESQTLLSGRAISTVLTGSKPSCECSLHVAFLFKKVRRGKQ